MAITWSDRNAVWDDVLAQWDAEPWTTLQLPWDRDTDPITHAWLGEAEYLIRRLELIGGSAFALQNLFDPTYTPVAWLPWVAQLAGVALPGDADEAERRALIRDAPSRRRGTPTAVVSAAAVGLSGTETVDVNEKHGGQPFEVAVYTYGVETADPAQVEQLIVDALPAHILLADYQAISGGLVWWRLEASFPTWADIHAAGSWAALADPANW